MRLTPLPWLALALLATSNLERATSQPSPCASGAALTRPFEVQGSGPTSPLLGQTVSLEGVVTGDFQGPNQLGGFFVQDAAGDAHPETSDGLFVLSSAPVNAGDLVRVTGAVKEFRAGNDSLTELDPASSVTVCGQGTPIAPAPVTLPVPAVVDLERFEGMLVTFPETLTVTDTHELGTFGELTLSSGGRVLHPNNGGPSAEVSARRSILLDDASTARFPNPIPYLDPASNTRRAGDTVSGLTGVLSFGFSRYRLEPTAPPAFVATNPRPSAPSPVGGRIRVASLNVLNFFTSLQSLNPDPACPNPASTQSRGANSCRELERQRAKIVAALRGLDADAVGLMELQNNGPTAVGDLVSVLNAALGSNAYAAIPDPSGGLGSDAIKVAILYKPARLTPVGTAIADPSGIHNRRPLAQRFAESNDPSRSFTLVVNHFKSKGSCPASSDPDFSLNRDLGQGCWNARRVEQARASLAFVEQLRSQSGDPDVLAVGDFNAYALEDPIKTLEVAGFENLDARLPEGERYSYSFDGFFGSLDHALASSSLVPQVAGASVWHINSDEPEVLDYNLFEYRVRNGTLTDEKIDVKTDDRYQPTPFRGSDHDPVLVGLDLAGSPSSAPGGVVISQVYGGGGTNGATFKNDFVELFNRGSSAVSLSGWSVQYASASGANWARALLPSVSLAPGQRYLVRGAGASSGPALPASDLETNLALSATAGKLALVRDATRLTCGATNDCSSAPSIVDLVGYGAASSFEGGGSAPALDKAKAAVRAQGGCRDANDNRSDFSAGVPQPRNRAAVATPCP